MSCTKSNIFPSVFSEKEQSWQIKTLVAQHQFPRLINGANDLQGPLQASVQNNAKIKLTF